SEGSRSHVPIERPTLSELLDGKAQRGVVGHRTRAKAMGVKTGGPRRWEKCTRPDSLLSIVTSSCVACSGCSTWLDSGPMSRTFLATLHYDGTGFVGWQRQPAGRSVQSEFERVLERLFGRRVVAHAAGRTDAGVHALGQGVSFNAPLRWTATALRRPLNALLPGGCWLE